MKSTVSEIYPEQSAILAPLAGYTDLAFRRTARACGCYYAFTPLVEAGSVVYGTERTISALRRGADEPWLGVQLLTAKPDLLAEAAHRLRDYPFDVVDLNMGCPVRKVTKRGAGAALCRTPELAARCVEALTSVVKAPVSAKIRIVDGQSPDQTVALAQILYEAGISALTIHGRTLEQVYSGRVAAEIIRAVCDALPIPVVANGGVMNYAAAAGLRRESGSSRIMIARGAIGNPWIFRSLKCGHDAPPQHEELCDALEEHVSGVLELYGEDAGLRYCRKIIAAYLCGRGYRRSLRAQVTGISTQNEFRKFMLTVRTEGPVKTVAKAVAGNPPDSKPAEGITTKK